MKTKSFGNRLVKAIKFSDMTQADFCRLTKIPPAHLSHIIHGERLPSFTVLERIATALYPWVHCDYLILGKPEMTK